MTAAQNIIRETLTQALQQLNVTVSGPLHLEHPQIATFGDYSSNVAMTAYPQYRERWNSPLALAEAIIDALPSQAAIAATTVAGPGFINFTLDTQWLLQQQSTTKSTGKKAVIEYMQPNTNKPLHVGHLRNAILGNSLIALLRVTGWQVDAVTLNNDRGLHITKSMWAYLMQGETHPTDHDWQTKIKSWVEHPNAWVTPATQTLDPKIAKGDFFVGYWYTKADAYVDDALVQKDWQAMLLAWENESDAYHMAVRALWKTMNAWFYAGAQDSYKQLGVQFETDKVSYESQIYEAGREIIRTHIADSTFEQLPDGAVRANLQDKFKLPDKILLRKDGTGIYMTFDIELTRQRSQQQADLLVWVVGADQDLYFKQLFAVAELLGYGKHEKFKHFSYGMVRLPEGKMSSRKGTVVYADDVIAAAVARASEVMESVGVAKDLAPAQKQQVAQLVGIGAIKYTMLSYEPKSEIAFDVQKSVTFEGNSGPYLQYAYARACSILAKAQAAAPVPSDPNFGPEESRVIHKLAEYEDVITFAAQDYAPNKVCTYLFALAQEFNNFYTTCRPIVGDSKRLDITRKFTATLKAGLTLLGISAPEVM